MDSSTPAGRLLAVFDAVRDVTTDMPFRQVWASGLIYDQGSLDEIANLTELGTLLRHVYLAASSVADSGIGIDRSGLLHGYKSWCSAVYGWNASFDSNHLYTGNAVVPDDVRHSLAATHGQLRGVLREGVLPADQRTEMLDHAGLILRELIAEVVGDDGLPEHVRVHLTSRLTEAVAAVTMVRYRGDQAVVDTLNSVQVEFDAASQGASNAIAKAPFQDRLIEWSETLRKISYNLTQALSVPTAISYFIATKDMHGAGLIASAGSPGAVSTAVKGVLSVTRGNVPAAIESGSDDRGEAAE